MLLAVLIQGADTTSASVRLDSLRPGCKIEVRPTGGGHAVSVGAWLLCGQDARGLLLAHPQNLLGQVQVVTGSQALDYVRLFSSSRWHTLFPEVKIVEVVSGDSDGIYVLEATKFRKHGREPSVTELRAADGKKLFQITRTAVSLEDLHLYEVVETVSETGYYELVSKRLLFKNATKLGMLIAGAM